LLLSLAASGCTAPTTDEAVESAASEVSAKLTAAELLQTKQAVRAIAYANIDRMDNWDEVRAELEPHIQKLRRHFGTRSATAKIPLVKGAWRQIWSDFPYPGPSFIKMDARQIYQVVTADGYYYNLGDNRALGVFGITGVLRGSYRPEGTKVVVQFTKSAFRFGTLGKSEDLYELAEGLESGERFSLSLPGGGKAPKGPVGISGTLENVYCDADLRVDVGTQTDFVDARGQVAIPGVGPKYFILDRVTTPVK
jgi:hypothetical protein